jgi:hypothetical protein
MLFLSPHVTTSRPYDLMSETSSGHSSNGSDREMIPAPGSREVVYNTQNKICLDLPRRQWVRQSMSDQIIFTPYE